MNDSPTLDTDKKSLIFYMVGLVNLECSVTYSILYLSSCSFVMFTFRVPYSSNNLAVNTSLSSNFPSGSNLLTKLALNSVSDYVFILVIWYVNALSLSQKLGSLSELPNLINPISWKATFFIPDVLKVRVFLSAL